MHMFLGQRVGLIAAAEDIRQQVKDFFSRQF